LCTEVAYLRTLVSHFIIFISATTAGLANVQNVITSNHCTTSPPLQVDLTSLLLS